MPGWWDLVLLLLTGHMIFNIFSDLSKSTTPSSPVVATNGSSKDDHSDFACSLRLHNTLPDIPFEPKFLVIPSDFSRFAQYRTTSLERSYKHPLLTEPNLGIPIDLIDPLIYNPPKTRVAVPLEDEPLLRALSAQEADDKRSTTPKASFVRPSVSWLRKTEYLSTNDNSMGRGPPKRSSTQGSIFDTNKVYVEKPIENDVDLVESTFDINDVENFVHPTNPSLKVKSVRPVLPDFEMWTNNYSEVIFDTDPLDMPSSRLKGTSLNDYIAKQQSIRGRGIIKGISDKF
eukprot:gene15256-18062_t